MSHPPPDVDIVPIDLTAIPLEIRQLLDDKTIIVPSETQNQIIGTALCSLREQLGHVAGQDTSHITPGVDQLQRLLHRLAVLRSPVKRLPPELLANIFELYVSREVESTPVYVSSHSPSRLVQVCKLWKDIAESDPLLWSSIHFYFPESHSDREDDVPKVKPLLDLHLKRSGALPISLTFTDHRIYRPVTESLVALLVDRLRTHARRWKRVSLQLSCGYFPLLFTFTPCDLSSLEHLHVSGDVLVGRARLRLNLESAVNLKSFTYSGPGREVDDQINLHWESLEEVSFEYAPHNGRSSTFAHQIRHLDRCQNITTLSLGIDQPMLVPNNRLPITLPCLHTLRVRRLSTHSYAQAGINPLILPQLESLEIDTSVFVTWNHRWHDRTFSALLERSACSLRHLSIQDVDFPNDELLRCLGLSPTLTSFRFIPCPRSQQITDVIHALDASRSQTLGNRRGPVVDGPLVPQLREITLASSVEGYLGLMMNMFRSRTGVPARVARVATLRRAEVVFFDMWHDTNVNRVSLLDARSQRVAGVQADLKQWVNENETVGKDMDMLEASIVVDSPYLPKYINVE